MDQNTLLIRNGFIHHPQATEEIRFFPGDANLPDRIIILDGDGGIFGALNWMSDQKIILVQITWRGEAIAVGGGTGFSAGLPLKWSGLKRKPVPNNWLEVSPRTMTWRKGIQNARHPINAMLNYGYGVLKAAIQGEIIAAGLSPAIGAMHGGSENKSPLVYDLMEPWRPIIDRRILAFGLAHTFAPGDFSINSFGGCRLNPQMARVVARMATGFKVRPTIEGLIKLFENPADVPAHRCSTLIRKRVAAHFCGIEANYFCSDDQGKFTYWSRVS